METPVSDDLPFVLLPFIFVLIGLVVVLIVTFTFRQERRLQKEAAERGLRALPRCPVCGGQTETGDLYSRNSYAYRFRSSDRRTYPIGAVRCTQCGHVDLFASQGDSAAASPFPTRL